MTNYLNAKNGIEIWHKDGITQLLAGADDPSVVGKMADVGSIYLCSTLSGALYSKSGTGDTEWTIKGDSETESFILRFNAGDLTEGQTLFPNKTTASGSPITGLGYDATNEESMYDSFQIPRYWKHDTDIKVTVSFFNEYSQEGSKVCRWGLDYHIYKELDTIGSKTTTKLYIDKSLPVDVPVDTFLKAEMIMPANDSNNPIGRDSTVTFRIYRDSTESVDTMEYDAVLVLLTFELKMEVI